jgi:putative ABC transport system permease protein
MIKATITACAANDGSQPLDAASNWLASAGLPRGLTKRSRSIGAYMSNTSQDLRFAVRQLLRSPTFAITAVLTLAFGVGANAAIFSLLDQALLRELPVRDPGRLVLLEGTGDVWEGSTHNSGGDPAFYFSYPMYKDLRDLSTVFDGIIATTSTNIDVSYKGESQNARSELVSGNYFSVLGVEPSLGRLFTEGDDQTTAASTAVLSYTFWKNNLAGDPAIIGQTVSINGHPFQIIGVTAAAFRSAVWGESPDMFVPVSMLNMAIPGEGKRLKRHTDRSLNLIARLKAGESRAHAEAASALLWHALRAEELKSFGNPSSHFVDGFLTRSRLLVLQGAQGFSYQRDAMKRPLIAVMAMAFVVLVIACVNVAILLLVRAAGRQREFALRYALGAGNSRIMRQLLLEGLLIGCGGGLAGMALALLVVRSLIDRLAGEDPHVAFISSVDMRFFIFNFSIALLFSIGFGLFPMVQVHEFNLIAALKQKRGSYSGSTVGLRGIVSLQIGLSVILLVAAGLFVRTMHNLRQVRVGFNTSHIATFGINPKLAGYSSHAIPALYQELFDTLAALPGIEGLAATDDPELADNNHGESVTVAGYIAPPDNPYSVEAPYINPGYFAALQIPLLAGRAFTESDISDHPKVAVVNETFAKHFCGSVNGCLGRMMSSDANGTVKLDTQIVGIVRDARHTGIREPIVATCFRPLKQDPSPAGLFLYLRTSSDPSQALTMIHHVMQESVPSLTLISLRTMDTQIDDLLSNERMGALLAIVFSVLAMFLAGVGLYGVLAYWTTQQTREIGIRIALGSTRIAVARIVVGDVLRVMGIGIALALPVAFGLNQLLRSQLFGVSPIDPYAITCAVLLIVSVALIAALIPTSRAAFIKPTEALRSE